MLEKINGEQKNNLLKCGFDVNDNTTIVEALKLFRDKYFKYVRVHISAYYVSEVFGYLSIEEQTNGSGNRWYSHGTHSWEQAESLALDYMLSELR